MISEVLLLLLIVFIVSALIAAVTRGATNLQRVWKYIFSAAGILLLVIIFGIQLDVPIFRIINEIFSSTMLTALIIILTMVIALIAGVEFGNWIEARIMGK